MTSAHRIGWRITGADWRPAGPAEVLSALAHPAGVDLDLTTRDAERVCRVDLPYPAGSCGAWLVTCSRCGATSPALGASGRPDDPRSVTLACRLAE